MIGELYVLKTTKPLYEGHECLDLEEPFLLIWIVPIVIQKSKKYSIVHKFYRFKLIGDILYMQGINLVLQGVPWKEELYKVLEENHEGGCGGHFAFEIILQKILQEG